MRKVPLLFPFSLALIVTLFGSTLFPSFHLVHFAPLLILGYYRFSFLKALWLSFGCGFIIDLLSSPLRLGLYGLNYTLISAFFYPQKHHFFEEKPLSFALFTAFLGAGSTLLQRLLLHLFERAIPFTWGSFLVDLFCMPFLDGVGAWLLCICPMKGYIHLQKIDWKEKWAALFKKEETPEE